MSEADKKALRRALLALEAEKKKTDALVGAVYEAVDANLRTFKLPPVPKPLSDRRGKKHEEVAVAVIADWQLAKVTPSYNSKIAERRVIEYAEKIIKLTRIQRAHHPVRKLEIWALGDIVEGELIFPGQSHLIDSSLYRQVTVDGPRLVGNFLRTMLTEFEQVHVHWVIGNHGQLGGRSSRDYNPETNADRMLGRIVQQILAGEKRLSWSIPEGLEDSWYDISNIGGYRTLLIHGDQIPGGLQTMNGVTKKVLGWKAGALRKNFNDVFMGHYHHPMTLTMNDITVRVSGSTESDNGYAKKVMASVSTPSQPLMFVKPGFGPTCEYRVRLK